MRKKVNTYEVERYPDEELNAYYRRLAKTADQRLLRLERLEKSGQEGFKNITKWSYQNAMADIQAFDGENARRFNTAPPTDEKELKSKIEAMKKFLGAKTSTKSSILSSYNKKAKSFNEKYGTNLTWEQVGNAYESKTVEKLNDKFASDTIARAIAAIKDEVDEQKKTIDKESIKNIKVKDALVQKAINEFLADDELDLEDLFGDY